jgi:Tfp pilus assembly protein PilN
MIDINLLPPEYAPKKLVSLSSLAAIIIFFLVCLSLIMSSLRLLAARQEYSGRVEYHDQQIKHYMAQVQDIRELREKVKLLKARLSLVKELLEEKTTWSNKLVDLCQCLPRSGIWIDGVTVDRQRTQAGTGTARSRTANPQDVGTQQVMVQISGSVVSVDKVSQFVANLEDSSTFGNVVFDSAQAKAAGSSPRTRGPGNTESDDSLISFRLTVEIQDET